MVLYFQQARIDGQKKWINLKNNILLSYDCKRLINLFHDEVQPDTFDIMPFLQLIFYCCQMKDMKLSLLFM